MAYYLVKPISDYYKMLHQKKANNPVDETSTMIESKRELRWICYFYRECVNAIKKREAKKKSSKIDSLPLPKFTEEHDQLQTRLCSDTINFDDFDLLLSFSTKPLKMTRNSVGSAIAWAFGSLVEQNDKRDQKQGAGLSLILKQYEKNDLNLSLAKVAVFVLSAFTKDGLGGSVRIENTEILKGLRQYTTPDMIDNWALAVVRFINSLEKESIAHFISDGNFVIEAGKTHPDILKAIECLVHKEGSTGHLRELIRRIKETPKT